MKFATKFGTKADRCGAGTGLAEHALVGRGVPTAPSVRRQRGGVGTRRPYLRTTFPTREIAPPAWEGRAVLSGQDGDDAPHYQEKQVRNAAREVQR